MHHQTIFWPRYRHWHQGRFLGSLDLDTFRAIPKFEKMDSVKEKEEKKEVKMTEMYNEGKF